MNVIYKNMPLGTRGVTVKKDGEYLIIINSRYSCEVQRETLLHELEHIKRNDFSREDTNAVEMELL